MKSKKAVPSEAAYILALLTLSFAVALTASADLGVSMIVAPAYVLSRRFTALTFGQCEYLLQSAVFVLFCILMRRVKPIYFTSYLTCLLYGAALDRWRTAVPLFNPAVTAPGSYSLALRIPFFLIGMLLTSFSVALFYRTYLYPQVYDFFVKGISQARHLNRTRLKLCFDFCCLCAASAMTLIFFGKFVGVGPGTLLMTFCNGPVIGYLGGVMDRHVEFVPLARRFSRAFDLN